MLIVDDLLTLPFAFLNLNLAPNIFIMIFESLDNFARDTLIEEINDRIKENRLLYELGELEKGEYGQANGRLIEKLNLTKKVKSSGYDANIAGAKW